VAGTEVADGKFAGRDPDREVVVGDVELGMRTWLAPAERVEIGDEMPAHPVHVDEGVDLHDLLELRRGVGERAVVGNPARRLVRHCEARDTSSVEVVVPEEQVVDPPQELATLGAGDDAMVVGVRERGDLADAELRERRRIGTFVLRRIADRADAEDETLTGHETRDRMDRTDHAGFVIVQLVPAKSSGETVPRALSDEHLVRLPERGEVERVGLLHARDEQQVRSVASPDVDREPQVHVVVSNDDRLAVFLPYDELSTGNSARARSTANAMRCVKLTFPAPDRARWLLRICRLTSRSFAGIARTDVAVGTVRLASMFSTVRAAAPRNGAGSSPSSTRGPGRGVGATEAATGMRSPFGGGVSPAKYVRQCSSTDDGFSR